MTTSSLIATMKNKACLTAAELHVLLDREFRRRRPTGCERCEVLVPFHLGNRHGAPANWEVLPPTECPEACHQVLEEVATDLAQRYDLAV